MTIYFKCKCEKNSLVLIYSLLALYFVLVCNSFGQKRSSSNEPPNFSWPAVSQTLNMMGPREVWKIKGWTSTPKVATYFFSNSPVTCLNVGTENGEDSNSRLKSQLCENARPTCWNNENTFWRRWFFQFHHLPREPIWIWGHWDRWPQIHSSSWSWDSSL